MRTRRTTRRFRTQPSPRHGQKLLLLQTLAANGDAMAKAIGQLTDDNARQQRQIQQQLSLAGTQNAQTQGRLNTDYASSLAAKVQELKENQRQQYNSNYLTAISAAMGQNTEGTSATQGTEETDTNGWSNSISVTTTSGGGRRNKSPDPYDTADNNGG